MSVVAAQLYRNGKNVRDVSLDEPIHCKGNLSSSGSDYSREQMLKQRSRRTTVFTLLLFSTLSKRTRYRKLIFTETNCL